MATNKTIKKDTPVNKNKRLGLIVAIILLALFAVKFWGGRVINLFAPNLAVEELKSANLLLDDFDIFRRMTRDEAMKKVNRAIWLNPNLASAYVTRIKLGTRLNRELSRAEKDYAKVLKLIGEPQTADEHFILGAAHCAMADEYQANRSYGNKLRVKGVDELSTALIKDYANPQDLYFERGKCVQSTWIPGGIAEMQKQTNEMAYSDYSKALKIAPHNTQYLIKRAMVGDYSQSMADFEKLETLEPNQLIIYWNRAIVRRINNDEPDLVIADLNKALEILEARVKEDPNYSNYINLTDIYGQRGAIYNLNKKHKEAIEDLTLAIKHNTDKESFPALYYNRGLDRLWTADYEGSLADFQNSIRALNKINDSDLIDRNLIDFWLAYNYLAMGEDAKAVEKFLSAARSGLQMNKSDYLTNFFNNFSDERKKSDAVQFGLATMYYVMEDYDKVKEQIKKFDYIKVADLLRQQKVIVRDPIDKIFERAFTQK